jgi:uncharacterized integral membrane protein
MSVARVILILVVIGSLTLFVVQNAVTSLSLVFLGMRSLTLPLSLWILLSLAMGVLTSFLISGLVAFSNYLAEKEWENLGYYKASNSDPDGVNSSDKPPRKPDLDPSVTGSPKRENYGSYQPRNESGTPSSYNVKTFQQDVPSTPFSGNVNVGSVNNQSSKTGVNVGVPNPNIDDDWVDGEDRVKSQNDDWDNEEDLPLGSQEVRENPKNYEFPQQPKTQSWSGSVYSFGYREPQDTGVGKTESVYDANFRVITPPYTPPPGFNLDQQNSNINDDDDDEDWGLDDDDGD